MSTVVLVVLLIFEILMQTNVAYSCRTVNGVVNLSGQGLTNTNLRNILRSCTNARSAETLDLSGNHLTSISREDLEDDQGTVIFYNLKTLNVSFNDISRIENDTLLRNAFQLESFDISFNKLDSLPGGLLNYLYRLKTFNASSNNISHIDKDVFNVYLPAITYIDLHNNSLTAFEPWPYVIQTEPRQYYYFDLSYNKIETLTNNLNWRNELQEPYQRIKVNVTYNNLSHYHDDLVLQYRPGGDVAIDMFSFYWDLRFNPWFCDCNMHYLVSRFQDSVYRHADGELYHIYCDGPWQLKGKDVFYEVNPIDLICNVTENCPPGCECQRIPEDKEMKVTCIHSNLTTMPIELPQLQTSETYVINLDSNQIKHIDERSYEPNVSFLSISKNGLLDINDKAMELMTNLEIFNVSNNALTSVPKHISKMWYEHAYIDNNPLVCDCEMTWMKDWIQRRPIKEASRLNIECTRDEEHHKIVDVTQTSLNCKNTIQISIAVSLGILLVVVIIIVIWAKRCPYETKVLLFKYFRFHPADKYIVDKEHSMEYDLYVSMDDESIYIRQWVLKVLVRKLQEEKPRYRVFIPCRDLDMGGHKSEDIITAMGRSSRVLIILSSDYERNEWCHFECQQAEILDHNEGRVLFMKYQSSATQMIEKEPWKSRVKGRKILDLCDKKEKRWFWSKLRYELPVSRKANLGEGRNYEV